MYMNIYNCVVMIIRRLIDMLQTMVREAPFVEIRLSFL